MVKLRDQKGFTLAELIIAIAASAILAGFVAYTAMAFRRGLRADTRVMDVQLRLNNAMDEITHNLRRAGFGVDPRFAFDLDINNDGVVDADGGNNGTDELRFVYREVDPRFYWQVLSASCDSLLIYTDPATNPVNLRGGAILFLLSGDRTTATFVRVAQAVNVTTGPPTSVNVPLVGNTVMDYNFCSNNIDGKDPTGQFPSANTPAFDDRRAVAMLVRYFRYYIRPAPQSPDGQPALMLDTGVDLDGDGAFGPGDPDDHILIERGIEDLQVEYTLAVHLWNKNALSVPDPVFSAGGGGFVNFDRLLVPSNLSAPYGDQERMLYHPANIRKVRVYLVGRAMEEGELPPVPRPAIANHTSPAGSVAGTLQTNDRLFRQTIWTEVIVRNMLSKVYFRRILLSTGI